MRLLTAASAFGLRRRR